MNSLSEKTIEHVRFAQRHCLTSLGDTSNPHDTTRRTGGRAVIGSQPARGA